MNESGEMMEWNFWHGKPGETSRKTYPDSVSHTTKSTWSDRTMKYPYILNVDLTRIQFCINQFKIQIEIASFGVSIIQKVFLQECLQLTGSISSAKLFRHTDA